jgi:hypothetical protein
MEKLMGNTYSKYKTVDEFIDIYTVALTEYLMNRVVAGKKNHIEDLSIEAAGFSEAFYATISALNVGN